MKSHKFLIKVLLLSAMFLIVNIIPADSNGQWHKAYQEGINAMKKIDWQTAVNKFQEALKDKKKDKNKQRAYGTIFIEYFPHRELGICYYNLGDLANARAELSLSIKQSSTPRARKYMKMTDNAENPGTQTPVKPAAAASFPEWYDSYKEGLKVQAQSNWFKAIENYQNSVRFKNKDKKSEKINNSLKTEYYPHREMGICYFNLGDFEKAAEELNLSIKQSDSKRAREFLNLTIENNAKESDKERARAGAEAAGGKPSFPAMITVTDKRFIEPSGNNALDSEESAEIKISIENATEYPGDIHVKLTPLSDNSGISIVKDINIGIVEGFAKQEITIPILATKDVLNQEVKFRIEVIEKYYHMDPDPFTITFNSLEFAKPELVIILKDYTDSKDLAANNNDNGQVDQMEMIKVEVSIQNIGEGLAKDVKATIHLSREADGSIFFRTLEGEMVKEFDLGSLNKGEFKRIPFLFFTNTFYNYNDVLINVTAVDGNNYAFSEKQLNLPMGVRVQKEDEVRIDMLGRPGEVIVEKSNLVDVDEVPVNEKILGTRKNTMAVIIGIENYKYNAKATYKSNDARIMFKYMTNVMGIPDKNINLQIDDGATKGEMDYVFDDKMGWLKKRVKPGVTDVIVYLAGHGYPDVESDTPYFIPQDIRAEQATNGLSLREIYGKLNNLGAKNVIVFVESCFSGLSSDNESLVKNINPVRIKVKYPELQNQNFVVITAASGQQVSSNSDNLKHGVFTYHLLKGLKGKADADSDKSITIEELWKYLEENVRDEALNLDREQDPLIFPSLNALQGSALLKYKIVYN